MATTPMSGSTAPPDDGGTIDTQLSRGAIGLPAVVMQALTHVAPAAGAIVTIQFIAQLVGLTTPLAFLIAFLICIMLAASLTQLARHLPSAGGYYTYVSRTVGPRAGFMTAWMYFLYDPIQGGMNLAFAGWFMNSVLGTLYGVSAPWLWPITLGVGTVLITFLMYRGIQLSGRVLVILGMIEILIFVGLAATGFVHSGPGGVSLGVFNPAHRIPHGGSMFLAVVFSIFAFTGFEACVPLAEESRHPRKNIPRAIMISIIVGGLFYVLISWGIISGWGTASLHGFEASSANPIVVVGKRLWGGAAVLILLAYLNSIFGACFSGNNAASRVFFGMGRSHALPAALGKVSGKAHTPTNAITLQAFLTLAVGFGMSLALGPANQLYLLATVITLGLSLVYIAGNIGVMRYYLTERRAELNPLLHIIFPVASSVALVVVCYKSVVPLPAWPVSLAPFITIGWVVIGLVVVALLQRSGRAEWLQRAGDVLKATVSDVPSGGAGPDPALPADPAIGSQP
jgi:amino acid transporter